MTDRSPTSEAFAVEVQAVSSDVGVAPVPSDTAVNHGEGVHGTTHEMEHLEAQIQEREDEVSDLSRDLDEIVVRLRARKNR